jgi:twinkle protein
VVKLPYKDMNECLQKGITKEIIQQCFNDAKTLDPEELVSISKYTQSIKDIFKSKNNLNDPVSLKLLQKGYALPWNIKDSDLRFRPDELSVWTGFNGHGKSQLLGYLVLQFIMQGAKVCIASLEMKPGNLGERLYRQISGLRYPAEEKIDRISSFFENRLFLFDRVGTVDIDKLLEIFKYARQRYGVDQFVIDSLMKCGLEENDYDAQKAFMDKICDFKNEYNCHVHLYPSPMNLSSF